MKIEKELLDDHQVQLTVEVDADIMESNKRRAARQLAKRGKIPGFRPGKAPYDVIVRNYGEAAIVEKAIDMLVDEIYPQVLDEAEIQPAAAGSLEKVEELDPPKLVFKVPLAPEIELGDYHSIRLPYKYVAPGKKELEVALEDFRRMYATTETVTRQAELEDYVMVDINGELAKPKEGQESDLSLSRKGLALVVRKDGGEDEWPYPGFSGELVGLGPGDTKTIKHKFPKDDPNDSFKGQSVNFEVTMKTVRSMKMPELNDDLAKMTGQYDSLEDLKTALSKDLETRAKEEYDDEYYVELLEKIKAEATMKYPPQVIEHEIEHVLDGLRDRLSQQGLDLETYFKTQNTTREKFIEEEARPVAIKRLERSLVLDRITREENIEVNENDLQTEFGQTLSELQYQGMDLNQVKGGKQGQQKIAEAIAMQSANRLLTRRTLERLKAIATGEYKKEQAKKETETAPKKKTTKKKTTKSTAKAKSGAKKKAPGKSKSK